MKGKSKTKYIDMGDAGYLGNGYDYSNYANYDGYGDYYYPQQLGRDIGILIIFKFSRNVEMLPTPRNRVSPLRKST